ncbi:DNA-directed RNA polymerase subunit beta [Paenibacillus mesophilus]|uniref:DNA-directed RNA polymerase subunit beta n=1 Tax=Paenibacillus mesophilus TaxID=2582849 RepID=UPI00110D4937|nr:DNA-directed RNA polymerase subunit beta [Paenibacillus mesophilus]TMV47151.1 DNA-directed RNA polymerase subunit beta [Paenibacillus mesophilus]
MNDKETNVRPKPKAQASAAPKRKLRRRWVRMLLWLLKVMLVPALCIIALCGGLWLGYVYIGGKDGADVWQWSTWKHLFDLVFAS